MDPNEKKIIESKPEEKKTSSKQKRAMKNKQSKAEDIKKSSESSPLNVPQMSITAIGRTDTTSGSSKDTKNLEPQSTGNQSRTRQRNKKSNIPTADDAKDVKAAQKSIELNLPQLSISDKDNSTMSSSDAGSSTKKQESGQLFKAPSKPKIPESNKSKSNQKKSKKEREEVDKDVSIISEGGDTSKDRRKANAEDSFAELENLTGLSLKAAPAALRIRPKFQSGNEGRKTILRSNFFRLKLSGSTVYQYDVSFNHPDNPSIAEQEIEVGRKFRRVTKKIHQQLLAQFVSTAGRNLFIGISYAFDGDRILLTNRPIKAENVKEGVFFSFPFKENDTDNPTNYQIRIRETNSVSLEFNFNDENYVHDRTVLQMLDIITKSYAFKHNIVYGSKIFFPANVRPRITMSISAYQKQNRVEKPTPFELTFGYHQSTQFCQSGPMQNIDRATAVLYREGPLLHRVFELLGRPIQPNEQLDYRAMDQLKEFIALRVETRYRGFVSRHSIRSFTRTPCAQTMFANENSRSSVADYFWEKYRIQLKYPLLPCIEYGQGKYLPIELCHLLPDQRNQRKLREDLIKILSTHATSQKPSGRAAGTAESARSICSNPALAEFGITLNPNMVEVPGRILPAPKLRYSNDLTFVPVTPGDWNMQQPNKKEFYSSMSLSRWAILSLSRKINSSVISDFCKNLQKVGSMVGVQVKMPPEPIKTSKYELRKAMETLKPQNLQLILCIIPEEDEIYTEIKSVGDRTLGVPTQIVLDKHYNPKGGRQKLFDTAYLSNLLLKINSKIGGINLSLSDVSKPSILKGSTMVVGVDVNHPSPGENSPSIAAVVGSLNPELSNYHTNIVINRSREETVDVRGMIKPILEAFKKHRGSYPDNIVVYRDGVSEGQFAYVLAYEVFPLRDMLIKDYSHTFKLTYMIVQKRHNARFFPTKREDSTRSENILPGCVIDTTVCHYKWFDFYLCSQNSFLGTARPGKYTVLWDENNLTADELQKVTYYLCYLFARSTKSIADPAPARYAHHAAARGKVHLKDLMRSKNQMGSIVDLSEAIRVVAPLQDVLYFI